MREIEHIVACPMGLHARKANHVIIASNNYKCNIHINSSDKTSSARSMVGIISLALKQGQKFTMTFDGEDEEEAATFFEDFVKKVI